MYTLEIYDISYKFSITRNHFSTLYIAFIRQQLKYSLQHRPDCTVKYADKLKQVQITSSRIIPDLPIIAPRNYLYTETGYQPCTQQKT